jgi:hypothetical protein
MILLWRGWWLARHVLHSWLVSFCTQLGLKCSKLASFYTCWLLIENLEYKNTSNDISFKFYRNMMIQNLGKTHLFFTVSSLKTTRKTSAGPGVLGTNFFFGVKSLHLVTEEKGLHQYYTGLFFLRKMAQSHHISRTKENHTAEFTRFRQ